jgi:hypothetical protein
MAGESKREMQAKTPSLFGDLFRHKQDQSSHLSYAAVAEDGHTPNCIVTASVGSLA